MTHMNVEELQRARWPVERARQWYRRIGPICGFNYVPRTAVNTTELWQALDEKTIGQELGWARSCGFNSLRVFVQYIVYEAEPDALIARMDRFLEIAAQNDISVIFVLFDDCFGPEPQLGPQPNPIPGIHNSRWSSSPGERRKRRENWPSLARYLTHIIGRFAHDERVIVWDLYNEPQPKSRPLVEGAFAWARSAEPSQPLTACWEAADLWDIASFHEYEPPSAEKLAAITAERPALCTECICRTTGSTFEVVLPLFAQMKIGWYTWGLVKGRTQTYYPWDSPQGAPEQKVWHHDLLHADGTLYDAAEIRLIQGFGDAFRRGNAPAR